MILRVVCFVGGLLAVALLVDFGRYFVISWVNKEVQRKIFPLFFLVVLFGIIILYYAFTYALVGG